MSSETLGDMHRALPRGRATRAFRSMPTIIDNITGFIHVKDALRRITERVTDPDKQAPVRAGVAGAAQKLGKLDIVAHGAVRAAADAGGRPAAADAAQARPYGDRHRRVWRHRRRRHHRGSARGGGRRDRGRARHRGRPADQQDQLQHLYRRRRAPNWAKSQALDRRRTSTPASMPRTSTPSAAWCSRWPAGCRSRARSIGGIKNFEFEVLQADARQLRRIKIKRLKQRKPPAVVKAAKPQAEKKAAE